jgi:predicted SnoaL-like aldol condensation-catalyzing enzyme
MTNEQARQFVSALLKEVFEQYNHEKAAKFFSPDLTGFLLDRPIDFDGIIDWLNRLQGGYPTLESMVHQIIVEDLKIAAVVNISLTAADGNKLYVSLALFIELSSKGRIIKWRSFTNS